MKRLLLIAGLATVSLLGAYAKPVEFDKIRHWAGSGEKSAALLIQFNDGKQDVAYVWGYRWDGTASGEDMMRAVCASSKSLAALVQYTGSMGSTLNGVGLSKDRSFLADLKYDFDRAAVGGEVNFDYFTPNTSMGQTDAPGDKTPELVQAAIDAAKEKGIIEHPLNARRYGYPAYDYDYWHLSDESCNAPALHWQSGWYEGYWSYWVGSEGEELSYSGFGMSSAQLADRSVNMWNYSPDMADFGSAPEPSENLDYDLAGFDEEMREVPAPEYPVDFDNIAQWIGSGEKYAAFVLKYNDGIQPDNFVIGYRWSGGWDDRFGEALKVVTANEIFTSRADRAEGGEWNAYGIYPNEPDPFKLNDRLFVSPRSVIVYTCTCRGQAPDYQLENLTYEYDKTTGADPLHRDEAEAEYYDLSGRRISTIEVPGIYIEKKTINNRTITKKFIVK